MSKIVYSNKTGNKVETKDHINEVLTCAYAKEKLVDHLEYDAEIKNVIKEINSIRDIVCGIICKNKNIYTICDNCPFYSSSYGCRFSYINIQIYKEFGLLKINHEIEMVKND